MWGSPVVYYSGQFTELRMEFNSFLFRYVLCFSLRDKSSSKQAQASKELKNFSLPEAGSPLKYEEYFSQELHLGRETHGRYGQNFQMN